MENGVDFFGLWVERIHISNATSENENAIGVDALKFLIVKPHGQHGQASFESQLDWEIYFKLLPRGTFSMEVNHFHTIVRATKNVHVLLLSAHKTSSFDSWLVQIWHSFPLQFINVKFLTVSDYTECCRILATHYQNILISHIIMSSEAFLFSS